MCSVLAGLLLLMQHSLWRKQMQECWGPLAALLRMKGLMPLQKCKSPSCFQARAKCRSARSTCYQQSASLPHTHDRMSLVHFSWAVLALWVMFSCSMQVELTPPDPADEEAVAYYNAQRGMHSKANTLKRGMAATRRKPAVAKF